MKIRAQASSALLACVPILAWLVQVPPLETQGQPQRKAVIRRFLDRPPANLEVLPVGPGGPRFVVTNLYQEPLNAFVVQTEPASVSDLPQTLPWDALDGGFAPIARGLSLVQGVPHRVGGPIPAVKLVAAVWADGSTFGSHEWIQRIYAHRSALARAFERALHVLEAGLEKQWTREQYLAALDQEVQSETDQPESSAGDSARAALIPAILVKRNLQGGMRLNGRPAPLEFTIRKLIEICRERRDSLTPPKPD